MLKSKMEAIAWGMLPTLQLRTTPDLGAWTPGSTEMFWVSWITPYSRAADNIVATMFASRNLSSIRTALFSATLADPRHLDVHSVAILTYNSFLIA